MTKRKKSGIVSITIPEDQWEQTGGQDDPGSRLLATLKINNTSFHLEAVEVARRGETNEFGAQVYTGDAPSWIIAAVNDSADYEPVETTEIGGRHYVLIATPYQR